MAPHLGSIQVVRLDVGWLVSLRLLGEGDGCAYKAEEKKGETKFRPTVADRKKQSVCMNARQHIDRFVDPL